MTPQQVQTLVLRAPRGPAVAHLLLQVPEGRGQAVAGLLRGLRASFGPQASSSPCCSLGFSFAGLEALGVPDGYLRLFRRLAPAYGEGAVRRSVQLGDGGASAAKYWHPAFRQERAHALVSWHGEPAWVRAEVDVFSERWRQALGTRLPEPLLGARLGAPRGERGEWVHFGLRDGLSEVCIDSEDPPAQAPDCRRHAPGALLLGDIDDAGTNAFSLGHAPEKVRQFFHNSSFGILRPMLQDVAAFEDQIERWRIELAKVMRQTPTRDFVKAKLSGRWPDGRLLRPGEVEPQGDSLALDLAGDALGEGCPFGSHVRRMRAAPDRNGNLFARPLQRRGLPFGPPSWTGRPHDGRPRGLHGQFFCASIEDQFEHLLGQWAAGAPLGFARDDRALDPLIGPHEDAQAALMLPLQGRAPQPLQGFKAWTTTLGTLYAWHPGRAGLEALLANDFVRKEDEEPWL